MTDDTYTVHLLGRADRGIGIVDPRVGVFVADDGQAHSEIAVVNPDGGWNIWVAHTRRLGPERIAVYSLSELGVADPGNAYRI